MNDPAPTPSTPAPEKPAPAKKAATNAANGAQVYVKDKEGKLVPKPS